MPWDPIQDLREWQERLSRHQADPWSPPVDVYETPSAYVITVEVPGLARDQIELVLEHTRLTIRGRRPDRLRSEGEMVRYHQVERGHGPFSRTFEFAERVSADHVSADLSNGVLTITLQKAPESPARK